MVRLGYSVEEVGNWFVAQGNEHGLPTIVRGRNQLGELRGHPALATRVTIEWQMAEFDEHGLPTVDESARMSVLEDAAVPALERDGLGLLTIVLTSNRTRTWTFYVGNVQVVGQRLNEVLPHDPPLPIELSATDDPMWSEYEGMLDGTGAKDPPH